jgi:SAM-dependent methyltransferase
MNKGDNSGDDELGYRNAFKAYGESPQALQWANYRSMATRYRELVADLFIDGKTILDAGCGMGDLLPYLYAKSSDFSYKGIDIIPEFVEVASKRYKGHEFAVGNPFSKKFKNKYDIVISSGVMNHNIPSWLEKRKQMVENLFDLSNEVLAFNMAGSINTIPHTSQIAYAKTQDVIEFCTKLSSKIIFRNHYQDRDFTIIMFK